MVSEFTVFISWARRDGSRVEPIGLDYQKVDVKAGANKIKIFNFNHS